MIKKITVIAFLLLATKFSNAQTPNWSDNIATIIYSHCSNCHRAGGLAPFPLMSFNDVDSNSNDIYNAVFNKVMPPPGRQTQTMFISKANLISPNRK